MFLWESGLFALTAAIGLAVAVGIMVMGFRLIRFSLAAGAPRWQRRLLFTGVVSATLVGYILWLLYVVWTLWFH